MEKLNLETLALVYHWAIASKTLLIINQQSFFLNCN